MQGSLSPVKALVTGATGLVGSHLTERLLSAGVQVACLVRPASDRQWLAGLPVTFRQADWDDADALGAAVAGTDYVFHVAGLTRARTLEDYLAVNERTTQALLAAAIRAGGARRRFVYVSSLAAVGPAPTDQPLDESAPPRPLGFYGQSKLAGERACLSASDRLSVTIVRPPGVYGPRDTNFLPLFRTTARLGVVPIIGRADKRLALVHVRDLAEGIWRAAEAPAGAGRTYFLGGGTHTLGEFARALADAVDRPPRLLCVPGPLARLIGEIGELKWTLTGKPQIVCRRKVQDALQDRWTCTWRRAVDELGYRPEIELGQGLRDTAGWYVRQGWLKDPCQTSFRRR